MKFEILRWMQYLHNSALLNNGLILVSIVGIDRNALRRNFVEK
jgi:hypothetical protein